MIEIPDQIAFTLRSCQQKRRYFAEVDALIAAEYRKAEDPTLKLRAYRCRFCDGWHLTSSSRIYVDPLMNHGWILKGKPTQNCHMFIDAEGDIEDLHRFAITLGLKTKWFQTKSYPHYDLTYSRRELAIQRGAIEVDRRRAVEIWREGRASESIQRIMRKENSA